MSAKHARIRPGPGNPIEHAQKIAEYATEAWYGHHGSGALEIPVSVVAALALVGPPFQERNQIAGEVIGSDVDVFCTTIRCLWHQFLLARPDLINRVWPLVRVWEDETFPMSVERRRAAKHVGTAALRNDLFSLNATDGRWETDLLGKVLTTLRPKSAAQGRGQYYTPEPLTELMGAMTILDLDEDQIAINDCACGTGGMFRGAAAAMRSQGKDPTKAYWEGNDTDELAVACCAVNVVLWGLGKNVLLGVGDTIKYDWRERAIGERRETIELVRDLRMLALLRDLDGTLRLLTGRTGKEDPTPATEPVDHAEPTDHQPNPAPKPEPEPPAPRPRPVSRPAVPVVGRTAEIDLDPTIAGELTSDFWGLVDLVTAPEK